jgi:hypothetical protein
MNTAHAIRQTGQQMRQQDQVGPMADYTDKAAEKVERFASYLQERDTNQILSETERIAREKPAMFLASAFALGLAAARFFRSSPSQTRDGRYDNDMYRRQMTPSATFPVQRTTPTTPSTTTPSTTSPSHTAPHAPQSGSGTSPAPGSSSSSDSQSAQRQPTNTPITPPRNRGY